MTKKKQPIPEHRKYIRLDTVFPVAFRILSLDGRQILSDELQGFTNNIGKGGICLVVNNLRPDLAKFILQKQAKLSLNIELPITGKLIPALAKIAWYKVDPEKTHKYFIGLNYQQINPVLNNIIIRYARIKKLFVPATLGVIAVLALALFINSYVSLKLIKGNKALVEQLVMIVQESSVAKQKVKEINREKEDLQLKIETLQSQIQIVEEEKEGLSKGVGLKSRGIENKIERLGNLLEQLVKDKSSLQDKLISLQQEKGEITEELLRLDKKKAALEKANIDKMYQWLKVHQNPRTGLVLSFEGDEDLGNFAFTYDQALAMQAYNYFSDFARVRKLLDFFKNKAKKKEDLFFNAYYANEGEPAEDSVLSGPNIWLGIAILQYTNKTGDEQYLKLSEAIAQRIIEIQKQDKEGGISGGLGVNWQSTEHNLDAYAFFNLFYNITQDEQYLKARDGVLNWLLLHTYDDKNIPVKRGKGDSTIATDTNAWSIASIGVEKLIQAGLNPERIIEFAEDNCLVEVSYIRPEGKTIKIKGFDFAAQKNLARAGVVSSEWTAQMIIIFKIMAEYYYNKGLKAKAHAYEMKADEYMSQLSNMIISSSSPFGQGESCLPYATDDFVDTGHGWETPKGKSTGSVAATVYTLFAYYNYNPLRLAEE